MQDRLKTKYLARLDTLISAGNDLLESIQRHERQLYTRDALGNPHALPPSVTYSVKYESYVAWFVNCNALADCVVETDSPLRDTIKCFQVRKVDPSYVRQAIGILTALRDSLAEGILDDLRRSIATAVSSDYLSMADELLGQGTASEFGHVPAAVLAGAVLEQHLRQMCEEHSPALPTKNEKGERVTLYPLIESLRKAGAFNETRAKQLRAWADIRNRAAHGQFDEFDRNSVQLMVQGIIHFLQDY